MIIENFYNNDKHNHEKISEETTRGVVCQCGGNLVPSNNLILSDDYSIAGYTVQCKESPGSFRRDEVWRYYFYNTYICNNSNCGNIYPRSKTQYYEDWGFCSHGGGGRYPLNVNNRIQTMEIN